MTQVLKLGWVVVWLVATFYLAFMYASNYAVLSGWLAGQQTAMLTLAS